MMLHVARVLADPGADLELSAGLAVPRSESGRAKRVSAVAHVLTGETGGRTSRGSRRQRLPIRDPRRVVAEDGFSYWMEFAIEGAALFGSRKAAPPPRSAS